MLNDDDDDDDDKATKTCIFWLLLFFINGSVHRLFTVRLLRFIRLCDDIIFHLNGKFNMISVYFGITKYITTICGWIVCAYIRFPYSVFDSPDLFHKYWFQIITYIRCVLYSPSSYRVVVFISRINSLFSLLLCNFCNHCCIRRNEMA